MRRNHQRFHLKSHDTRMHANLSLIHYCESRLRSETIVRCVNDYSNLDTVSFSKNTYGFQFIPKIYHELYRLASLLPDSDQEDLNRRLILLGTDNIIHDYMTTENIESKNESNQRHGYGLSNLCCLLLSCFTIKRTNRKLSQNSFVSSDESGGSCTRSRSVGSNLTVVDYDLYSAHFPNEIDVSVDLKSQLTKCLMYTLRVAASVNRERY
ncbi:24.2 kDa [Spodoptera frugiperda ascovirus 1a]|uniref:24.2 kDa n=1 Tax=Spodoptera frugiperda ascovirus 1a TaxID=113370 RepID=Q0E595_SFAVA|nr:24.2 kDa [Spodoptera frugiperda ascovirus 1a]CAL44606.1 24.2 kDa [Spodoptera frugiperda ascovirus 1a]